MHKALAFFAVAAFLLACAPDQSPTLSTQAHAAAKATTIDAEEMALQVQRTTQALNTASFRIMDWYHSSQPRDPDMPSRSEGEGAGYYRDGEYINLRFVQALGDGAFRVVMPDLPAMMLGDWRLQYRLKRISRGTFEGWEAVNVDFADSTWVRWLPVFDGTDFAADVWWWYKDFVPNATPDSLTYDRVSFRLWLRPPVLSEE